MRWLLILLVVFALWYISGIEETPPPTAEESFIGNQVQALRKAEDFQKTYHEAVEESKKRMEEQLDRDTGG